MAHRTRRHFTHSGESGRTRAAVSRFAPSSPPGDAGRRIVWCFRVADAPCARSLRHANRDPMKPRRTLLLVAVAVGALAVAAGLAGLNRIAGIAAAVMVILILAAPWTHDRSSS